MASGENTPNPNTPNPNPNTNAGAAAASTATATPTATAACTITEAARQAPEQKRSLNGLDESTDVALCPYEVILFYHYRLLPGQS